MIRTVSMSRQNRYLKVTGLQLGEEIWPFKKFSQEDSASENEEGETGSFQLPLINGCGSKGYET